MPVDALAPKFDRTSVGGMLLSVKDRQHVLLFQSPGYFVLYIYVLYFIFKTVQHVKSLIGMFWDNYVSI